MEEKHVRAIVAISLVWGFPKHSRESRPATKPLSVVSKQVWRRFKHLRDAQDLTVASQGNNTDVIAAQASENHEEINPKNILPLSFTSFARCFATSVCQMPRGSIKGAVALVRIAVVGG